VGAALEENAHEHRLCDAGRRDGDALLERGEAELRSAVDGEHRAEALRDERAPRHAGARGERHAGLDQRQPASGLRGSAIEEAGAREAVAVAAVAHAACSSGLTAISWRSAFCTITGYCWRFHDARP